MVTAVVAGLAILAAACLPSPPDDRALDGVWRSAGFGLVLDVRTDEVVIYEYVTSHCMEVAVTPRRGMSGLAVIDEGSLVLRDAGREVVLDRIESVPLGCGETVGVDPGTVFAVAAATVEDLYVRGVDPLWDERRRALEPLVAAFDDDVGLFDALMRLLAPLDDRQITLVVPSGPLGGAWAYVAGDAVRVGDRPVVPGQVGEVTVAGDGGIATGDLGEGYAYLGFGRLSGFSEGPADSERVAAAILDDALIGATGVIIDLRAVSAGTTRTGLLLATRFVPEDVVVGRFRTGDGVDAGALIVRPLPTGTFHRPVVLIVDGATAGPAEVLVLSMRLLPFVTVVGEPTAGSPGQVLVRSLPNGWSLGVPNVDVVTPDGIAWTGRPISPDVRVLQGEEPHDAVLGAALETLRAASPDGPP